MKNRKLYFENPDCNYRSKFALLCETEEEVRKVDLLIEAELKKCVSKIKTIGKTFSGCGIGDTDTDEHIADRFYSILHWPWKT